MVADNVLAFIEHHGVKGQKWGVRNDKGHAGERAKTKKIAKLDDKFARNIGTFSTAVKLHNRSAQLSNDNDVDRINNKPEYKDKDFSRDSPLRRKYYKEHQDAFLNNLDKAASEFGTNASGTKKYKIVEGNNGAWDVVLSDVKHAEADQSFTVDVSYDDMGHITKLSIKEDVTHSDLEKFLEHHGVKGQKWGVRRKGPSSSSSPAHQVSKLTNEQLREAVNRMQLEQQYKNLLNPKNKANNSAGKDFAKSILKDVGKNEVRKLVISGIASAGTVLAVARNIAR